MGNPRAGWRTEVASAGCQWVTKTRRRVLTAGGRVSATSGAIAQSRPAEGTYVKGTHWVLTGRSQGTHRMLLERCRGACEGFGTHRQPHFSTGHIELQVFDVPKQSYRFPTYEYMRLCFRCVLRDTRTTHSTHRQCAQYPQYPQYPQDSQNFVRASPRANYALCADCYVRRLSGLCCASGSATETLEPQHP